MPTKDFLFELGVEEIPAGYIADAVNKLQSYFEARLKEEKLSYSKIKMFSTPRRFTIKITDLQTQQEDEIIERIGPGKNVAYDADGNLTKAALGFLKGADASPEDIFIITSAKGEKIAVKKEIKGRNTADILTDIIMDIVPKLNFPKSMRWGKTSLSFARPIRWLLALWGDEILPFELNQLPSGNISFGNRFQKLDNPVEINKIAEYEEKLKTVFVIPDRDIRKSLIEQQLDSVFQNTDFTIVEDKNLLEIVTDLVEYPTAVIADFDKKYLHLPQKVITSTLSQHQKYFAVRDKKGNITNHFVFISNGDPQHSNLIKLGNEKVVKARLEDADFFFLEDSKTKLSEFVPKLAEVTFQEQLGSLLEKTVRIENITGYILSKLEVSANDQETALRAARLCKADLVTQMLGEKEFTKLQGYMGMIYARVAGETENVATAIYEHYLPRGERDNLPASLAGAIVAIADKMDTVCGIIGVDMIPTGSKDPFALRRAANGIVQILDAFNLSVDLSELIDFTFGTLSEKLPEKNHNLGFVKDFFHQRIEWLLRRKEIDYDIIESVLQSDFSIIPDVVKKAMSLQKFKERDDFIKLVLGFKRVSNIIADQKKPGEVREEILAENAEKVLFAELQKLKLRTRELLTDKKFVQILEELVRFGMFIDKFFDDVLVNVEEDEIRLNRINLLIEIRQLFLQIADISKIVVDLEK